MSSVPFGLPAATSIYLWLYLLTWVAHFALAGAVLGGATLAAIDAWRGGDAGLPRRRAAAAIAKALPLLLGLAITAGVAPLLLVQVLYRDAFYTANLLLFVRYLAILPALLLCFYLLYLAKSPRLLSASARTRALVWTVAAALALFIGWSFVELHSLSLRPDVWIEHYGNRQLWHANAAVGTRLGAFVGLALVATAAAGAVLAAIDGDGDSAHTLAPLAILGALVSLAFAALYARELVGPAADAVRSGQALTHLGLAAVCAVAVCAAWGVAYARRAISSKTRWLLVATTVGWLYAVSVLREIIRGAQLDLPSRFESHAQTAETGGLPVFVAFLVINGALIAWCLTRVWRSASRDERETAPEEETP